MVLRPEGVESWAACADGRAGLVWIAAPKMGALRKGVEGLESWVACAGWLDEAGGIVDGVSVRLSLTPPSN